MTMELLQCGSCEVSLNPNAKAATDRMCPVVANKTLSGLGKLGIDPGPLTSRGERLFVLAQSMEDPAVTELAEEACSDRRMQLANTSSGFSSVVY